MSEAAPQTNLPEYSVSEIAAALRRTVEGAFPFVRVRGEISNLKFHSSGHVYFDLKDEKACLNAVVWRTAARLLKLKPELGLEVICTGRITTYPGGSRYQITVERIELAGLGALMAMVEERKKRLAAEGLFAEARKKPLPILPDVIGVITSPTGAVIRDIMHRLDARFPRRVLLWPAAVQGARATAEIAAAIRGFNSLPEAGAIPRPDLLIVARGGGSIEDLMAFNEEDVVRAAAESAIPLISAVGHETDTTLIDFAADRRAPTPSAAAEMAVPVRADLLSQILVCERRFASCFVREMSRRRTQLAGLARALPRSERLFAPVRQRFDYASERLAHALRRNVQERRRAFAEASALLRPGTIRRQAALCHERTERLAGRLEHCQRARMAELRKRAEGLFRMLRGVSYRAVLERGFVLVRGSDGRLRRRAASISSGESLTLVFADGQSDVAANGAPRESAKRPLRLGKSAKEQGNLF